MWIGNLSPVSARVNARWIDTPETGADVSHVSYTSESTLLNGGGALNQSYGSHKRYQFSWGESATPELASYIQGLANGTFGRGVIMFTDPMQYGLNILPSFWADPSMSSNLDAPSILHSSESLSGAVPGDVNSLGLPELKAGFFVGSSATAVAPRLRLLVPPGHRFTFGWIGTRPDVTTGMYIETSGMSGITTGYVAPLSASGSALTNIVGTAGASGGTVGLRLNAASATFQIAYIQAMTARIFPPGDPIVTSGPWSSGEGHTGCRFAGSPSIINYNGVDGGRMGVSCTLKETGAWE